LVVGIILATDAGKEKAQLPATWTGHGLLVCYSHYDTNAAFPEGASNEGAADVTCRPVDWQYPTFDLGPEAMFFTSDTTGEQFEIWAWDYHDGQDTIPYAECKGEALWYRTNDLGGGFCTPNRDVNGQLSACGIAHCVGEITCYGC